MFDNAFTSEALTEALDILKNDFPLAIWETIYVTLLSTLFAIIIGLPLGVLLVAGEKGGVLPLPKALMKVLNVIINLFLLASMLYELPSFCIAFANSFLVLFSVPIFPIYSATSPMRLSLSIPL